MAGAGSSGWPAAGRGIAGDGEDGRWQGEVSLVAGRWPVAEGHRWSSVGVGGGLGFISF
jgi:hypothetical protein